MSPMLPSRACLFPHWASSTCSQSLSPPNRSLIPEGILFPPEHTTNSGSSKTESAWVPLGPNKKDLETLKMLQFSPTSLSLLCTTGEGKSSPWRLPSSQMPSDPVLKLLQPTGNKSYTQAIRVQTTPKNLSTSESTSDIQCQGGLQRAVGVTSNDKDCSLPTDPRNTPLVATALQMLGSSLQGTGMMDS